MMSEQMIILEDWWPEDETQDTEYVEEEKSEVFRIIDAHGKVQQSYVAEKYNKPYYTTLKGARVALHSFPEGSRIQKGEVTWTEM